MVVFYLFVLIMGTGPHVIFLLFIDSIFFPFKEYKFPRKLFMFWTTFHFSIFIELVLWRPDLLLISFLSADAFFVCKRCLLFWSHRIKFNFVNDLWSCLSAPRKYDIRTLHSCCKNSEKIWGISRAQLVALNPSRPKRIRTCKERIVTWALNELPPGDLVVPHRSEGLLFTSWKWQIM